MTVAIPTKIHLGLILLFHCCFSFLDIAHATTTSEIPVSIVISPESEIHSSVESVLVNRLEFVLSDNDEVMQSDRSQFVLFATVLIEDNNVVNGPPLLHSVKLNIHLTIGEVNSGLKFQSYSFQSFGTGQSLIQAERQALSKIKPSAFGLNDFFTAFSVQVNDYFDENCASLLKDAINHSVTNFDRAFYELSMIPRLCAPCFERAQHTADSLYDAMMTVRCQDMVGRARDTWFTTLNWEGAQQAVAHFDYRQMTPECLVQSRLLLEEIESTLRDIRTQEQELAERQYSDSVKAAQEERQHEYDFRELTAQLEARKHSELVEYQTRKVAAIENIAKEYIRSVPDYDMNLFLNW